MPRTTHTKATAREIKRLGQRVSRGLWMIYTAPSDGPVGRLIVALGRSAGGSVTRSRVRRLARDVFERTRNTQVPLDMLLVARSDADRESRRNIRAALQELMARAADNIRKFGFPQETTRG